MLREKVTGILLGKVGLWRLAKNLLLSSSAAGVIGAESAAGAWANRLARGRSPVVAAE